MSPDRSRVTPIEPARYKPDLIAGSLPSKFVDWVWTSLPEIHKVTVAAVHGGSATTIPWRMTAGAALYGLGASLAAIHLAAYQDRPWALLALLAVPLALRWPIVLIGGSALLMLGYAGTGYADQTDLGRAAFSAWLSGESPYHVHQLAAHSNPFAYGPLAMLTAQVGPRLELVSAVGLLGVLAWRKAWITLSLLAGLPLFVMLPLTGINDYTPALLVVTGLLLLPSWKGGVLLGIAAAIKPYAAAWFLMSPWPWIVSAVLWAPMLPYLGDFLAMLRVTSGYAGWTPLRLFAPTMLGQPFVSWRNGVLLGAVTFSALMLFGQWWSLGYLVVLVPIVGLALEA